MIILPIEDASPAFRIAAGPTRQERGGASLSLHSNKFFVAFPVLILESGRHNETRTCSNDYYFHVEQEGPGTGAYHVRVDEAERHKTVAFGVRCFLMTF